jgi:DNA (cytosine-5)-methyltransferase 1
LRRYEKGFFVITVGELFAGIGGIGLGLEMTGGFDVKWQVEIDDYASQVLAKHWPDVTRWDDVCTFPPADGDWTVDMITAGFPCQDLSFAGKGGGLEGERSGLFYEVVRIASRLRPRYLLLENVAALLVRGLGEVLRALAEVGYDAEWHCLSAATVTGAPHIRDRIFILAYPNGNRNLPFLRSAGETGGVQEVNWSEGCARVFVGTGQPQGVLADTESERVQGLRTTREQILPPYVRPSLPLRESPGSGEHFWEIEPKVRRVVDGLSAGVDRAKRIKGLGNAVVPQVTQFIGNQILERLKDDSARR